jgi:hypothetical protein
LHGCRAGRGRVCKLRGATAHRNSNAQRVRRFDCKKITRHSAFTKTQHSLYHHGIQRLQDITVGQRIQPSDLPDIASKLKKPLGLLQAAFCSIEPKAGLRQL